MGLLVLRNDFRKCLISNELLLKFFYKRFTRLGARIHQNLFSFPFLGYTVERSDLRVEFVERSSCAQIILQNTRKHIARLVAPVPKKNNLVDFPNISAVDNQRFGFIRNI